MWKCTKPWVSSSWSIFSNWEVLHRQTYSFGVYLNEINKIRWLNKRDTA